jgi:hypothetical protein
VRFFAGDGPTSRDLAPDRHTVDPEEIAIAVIGLHQDTQRPLSFTTTRDEVPIPPLKS